jgi:hypothetical protein
MTAVKKFDTTCHEPDTLNPSRTPDSVLRFRLVNRINLFKEPLRDETKAVWTDMLLTILFPFILVGVVFAMALLEIRSNPFAYVSQQLSTAGADLPYPPYGLTTPITCRVPGGCLAISYFTEAPPDRSSVCFQRMKALRTNKCKEDNSCTSDCPDGNCCYDATQNPSGGFLCDSWVFLPFETTLNVDWCFSPRVNEGVFVLWSRYGGMGLDDSNKYEATNHRGKTSIKCEYIKTPDTYLNTFLTKACPPTGGNGPGGMIRDYSEKACEKICTVKDPKSGNTLYAEGISFTNFVTARDPNHELITPQLSESLYNQRIKSQVGYTCKNLMTTGFCEKIEPVGAGTAIIKLENKSYVGWSGTKKHAMTESGYYQSDFAEELLTKIAKGDVVQAFPIVTEEGSGIPPPGTVNCEPPQPSLNETVPKCADNYNAFENFIYNVPKDMDLLGVKTNWKDLGITNDRWLGTQRCAQGVGPNDRPHAGQGEEIQGGKGGQKKPTQSQINNCIMRERRHFMINYMRMSKLKVDVSYSQSKFEQSRLTTSIPILLGSMQSLIFAIFGGLAVILRSMPCVKSSSAKTYRLHTSLKNKETMHPVDFEKGTMPGAHNTFDDLRRRIDNLEQLVQKLSGQLVNMQQVQ